MECGVKVRTYIIASLCGCSLAYTAYKLLLTEEAKKSLSTTLNSMKAAYISIRNNIEDHYGLVIETDTNLPNVEKTKDEWRSIGY
jgi:predicted sugar kinase